jgi:chromo domain-containing protein 1
MIRYYAGVQVDMRRDYRHFFVVHTEPEAPYVQKWKDEIQTIGSVITPEQCVEEFEKSSEESMFDFCERYMEVGNGGDASRRIGGEA